MDGLAVFGVVMCVLSVKVSAESDNVNYGVVNTLLQSPVRAEHSPDARENENADFAWKILASLPENIPQASEPVAALSPESPPLPPPAASDMDVNSAKQTARESKSPFDEGVYKLTEIYRECSRKIDKRIENLMHWKFSKSRSEKDLIELKEYVSLLYRCLKVQSFRYFDSVIDEEVIPVSQQVEFVRDERSLAQSRNHIDSPFLQGADDSRGRVTPQYVAEIVESDWSALLLNRFSKLLQTHSMKFRIDDNSIQGRGRRRDHKMFAMMVMGFMVMASILIPMGFQFLTVLGGKSLLMAKMALIMSAINGLKKIAHSQVGYGFYHTAPEHEHGHHHGFHDKVFKVKRDPDFL